MNKNPYSIARRALLSLLLIICLAPAMAQLGISRNPAFVPAADAMLDVSVASLLPGAKMGILIPRMDHPQGRCYQRRTATRPYRLPDHGLCLHYRRNHNLRDTGIMMEHSGSM
ncbi:MAG: hypothetical protein IPG74_00265 [Flavobacteriales bacterium]|nr:hypothetical protein [Flavobacteriales bacterium]